MEQIHLFLYDILIGDIMKTKILYLHKLLLIISLNLFFGVFFVCSLHAANSGQKQAPLLDEIHAGKNIACADCHGNEGQRSVVAMITCLDCHDTTELAEATAEGQPTNPHENRHYSTEADCNLCHHQHKKSENFCLPCHNRFDFIVP